MSEFKGVLYDARTVRPGMSGVGRYTLSLLGALAALPDAPPIRALFLKEVLDIARRDPALASVECLLAPVSHEAHPAGDLWLWRGVRQMIRPGEVYHGPAFIIPGGRQPFARVSTVHDLFTHTHPQFYPFKFRLWLRFMTEMACRRAERIIVPAETVLAEILRRRFAPDARIAVIPEAPDATSAVWDAAARDREDALRRLTADRDRPILLTVGTLDARKDPHTARCGLLELGRILGGQPELPMALRRGVAWLWVGGPGPVPDDTPEDIQRKAKLQGFQTVGHAPGSAVQPALKSSAIYVTCSRTEGFGIPVVEAMAAGCPIVATDIPIHREVAGDAALYFPEGDARALGETLFKLLSDDALRETLAANGVRRSANFSWSRAAERTLQVYREASVREFRL